MLGYGDRKYAEDRKIGIGAEIDMRVREREGNIEEIIFEGDRKVNEEESIGGKSYITEALLFTFS